MISIMGIIPVTSGFSNALLSLQLMPHHLPPFLRVPEVDRHDPAAPASSTRLLSAAEAHLHIRDNILDALGKIPRVPRGR